MRLGVFPLQGARLRERRCFVGQVEPGWRGEALGKGGVGSEEKSLEGTARLGGGKGHVCKTGKTWKPRSVEGGGVGGAGEGIAVAGQSRLVG